MKESVKDAIWALVAIVGVGLAVWLLSDCLHPKTLRGSGDPRFYGGLFGKRAPRC